MKLLGYDFVTKETLKLFKSKDLIIDDVAVTRKNRKSSLASIPKFFAPHRSTTNVCLASGSCTDIPEGGGSLSARSTSPKILKPLTLRRGSEPGGMNQVQPLVQRTVIVTKDLEGFGLTVTGDNPVFVQTVKEEGLDGAAARAGVRQGDRIMKVNGTLVTGSNHLEVVKMISCGSYVALTLLGKAPQGESSSFSNPSRQETSPLIKMRSPSVAAIPTFSLDSDTSSGPRSPPPLHNSSDRKSMITGPTPLDEEKQAEWRKKRVQIIGQMLEEEKKHLEELRAECQKDTGNEKLEQLIKAETRIKNLESQLADAGSAEKDTSQEGDTLGVQPSPSDGKKSGGKAGHSKAEPSPGRVRRTTSETSEQILPSAARASARTVTEEPLECSGMHFVTPGQVDVDVIPMEDGSDDDGDLELVEALDMHGPFSNFADLKCRPAHLAVFLHYLISNSDPASLLFYLIADQYQSGSGKDLKKWAYEIHSTFLVPTGPFRVANIDKDLVESIDLILCSSVSEHEDQMRRIFIKAKVIALDDINEHLADFRTKRTLGLGNVFGESLLQELSPGDRGKELRIADSLLMQHFETFFCGISEFDQLDDRNQALAAALATVMKIMGVKPACNLHDKLLEKCPTFVTKDKGAKIIKKIASKRAVQIKGHHFLLSPVFTATFCYQCSDMIWGVNSQGYFCSNCDVVVHKQCTGLLEDSCYPASQKGGSGGPVPKRVQKGTKPVRKSASGSQIAIVKEEGTDSPPYYGSPPNHGTILEEEGTLSSSLTSDDALLPGEELDKTTDLPASPMGREWGSKSASADSGYFGDHHNHPDKPDAKPVGRSQSMRSRTLASRLQSSLSGSSGHVSSPSPVPGQPSEASPDTPGLHPRSMSDVDVDDKSIAMAISGGQGGVDQSVSSSSSSVSRTSLPEEEAQKLLAAADVSGDSDIEMDTEIPQLEDIVSLQTIRHLKPKEKKRQDVINELFHTERTHVRKLKILHKLFYTPLLVHQILPPDFVKLLFANLDEILELHSGLNTKIKQQRKREIAENNGLHADIGDLMLGFFDGETGEKFHRASAFQCQHQQYALEALRSRQKKDSKLQTFLAETESNPLCQKLQLKDMLPAEMQRLTKYPLLLETVGKYTPEESEELDKLKSSVHQAKSILNAVNTAKKNSENLRRVEDLQKRLDTSPFDKENHPMSKQYRSMDLRRFTLVHEGPLQWRLGKNKLVDLHVLLLEDLLLLSTRHSDGLRLSLKYYDMNMLPDGKWCPVLKLSSLMAKNVATDKKAFFLVSTSNVGPQIYELVAGTATAKKNWFKLITDQVDLCKQKESDSKREASPSAPVRVQDNSLKDNKLNDSGVSDASQGEEESGDGKGRNSERVQIVSQPRLINPSEIEVNQPTVYEHAEPVLTDLERVRRSDQVIVKAMAEKQKLLLQIFELKDADELNKIAEALAEGRNRQNLKDSKELVLSAIVQANRLLEAINEGMRLQGKHHSVPSKDSPAKKVSAEEEKPELVKPEGPAVACFRLTGIAAPLMRSLTAMLHSMQQTEEELKRVREELGHYKQLYQTGSLHGGSDKSGGETDHFSDLGSSPSSVGSSAANQDFIQPAPRVAVGPASSEETLTESKVGTPQVKTPDSLASPVGPSRLSPSRLSSASEDGPTPVARSPTPKSPVSPHSRSKSPLVVSSSPGRSKSPTPQSALGTAKVVQNPSSLPLEGDGGEKQKTPSPPSDDDDRKREKRKQKRQRHTALTGLSEADFPARTPDSADAGTTGKLDPVKEQELSSS